jgi:hypothetical protein
MTRRKTMTMSAEPVRVNAPPQLLRFVQIALSDSLFGLDAEGCVWRYDAAKRGWVRMSMQAVQ